MKVTIEKIENCCGKTTKYVFRLSEPVQQEHLTPFWVCGLFVPPAFTEMGIFYVYIPGLVITTAFGNNWAHVITDDETLMEKAASMFRCM